MSDGIERELEWLKQSSPLQGTESAAAAIQRVHYTHDAMIDCILREPKITQGKLAEFFGYTQAWVSRILNSDAFQARLAQRKSELVDPTLALTIDERLRALATKSLDVLQEKLELPSATFDMALETAKVATKALGYGARQNNLQVQQNFVVALPPKAPSASEWAEKYTGPSKQLQAMAAEVQEVGDD